MFVDTTTLWSLGAFVLFMAGAWYILSAISQRNTTREMVLYGLYCFALFAGGVILAGWVMWVLRH